MFTYFLDLEYLSSCQNLGMNKKIDKQNVSEVNEIATRMEDTQVTWHFHILLH